MSKSIAFDGYGIGLAIGDGATAEAFVEFAEIIDVAGPSFAKDTLDTSHSTSPDKYREFIDGFKDAGEVTLTANMTQTDYAAILAEFEKSGATAKNNYQITIPDDNYTTLPTIVFVGIVTGIGTPYPTQDKVTMDVTWKVTGKPVHTQGS